MQTQDAPAEFIFKLWPWFEANRNRIIAVAAALVVALAVYFFISSQKAQNEINAGKALTQLLMSPASSAETLLKIAQEYPGTAAGKRAQLQGAATLFGAGRYADAQAQFQKIIDASTGGSSKTFAAIAQAGLAASLEAQGKVKEAVAAYQKVVSGFAGSPSVGTAEFSLGRLAEQQGQLAEAVSHYENAARASVGGSLASEASVRASELKAKLALVAKPAAKS